MDIKTRMKNAELIGKLIALTANLPDRLLDVRIEMLNTLNKLEL
tara:strand:- start:2530 stop:2661 length:132 start_codon:yes stop_codon:yes gene_type:complete